MLYACAAAHRLRFVASRGELSLPVACTPREPTAGHLIPILWSILQRTAKRARVMLVDMPRPQAKQMPRPSYPSKRTLAALSLCVVFAGCECGTTRDVQFATVAGIGGGGGSSMASAEGGAGGVISGNGSGLGGGFVTSSQTSGGFGGSGGGDDGCVLLPQPGQFNPQLDCSWDGPPVNDPYPSHDDVVSTPVVINLTDDNNDNKVDLDDVPDIAFISYPYQQQGCCNATGVLRIVSGQCNQDGTMLQHYSVGTNELQADLGISGLHFDNSGHIAAGDIDADGSPDLVATLRGGGTIALEKNGKVKWYQPNYPQANVDHYAGSAPALADVDSDGKPEVLQGRVALNGEDGTLQWQGMGSVGTNGFMGPANAVGDVDLDGKLNLIGGNTLYDEMGNAMWTYAYPVPSTGTNCQGNAAFPCTGFSATGNFDADNEGEIVLVRAGSIYVLNHDGSVMQHNGLDAIIDIPKTTCGKNEGGPPTVADFDGDGQAEIGVAGANYYVVADFECLSMNLPPQCSDYGIRWKVPNQDCTSRVTGSSVFDFDGDGKAEVIYNDELLFRIMDGSDGTVLISLPNKSHTRMEMPIVADVDNDGNAEMVFVENAAGGSTQGIRVWGDMTNSWVATRRIWNQHAYHVTNVGELGEIPKVATANWLTPTDATVAGVMNNFRQNLPDFDVFLAPDLVVTLSLDPSSCPATMKIVGKVCNAGALVVGAGSPVTFWNNADQSQISCQNGAVATQFPLTPGKCENVVCEWATPPITPQTVDLRACVDNGGYDCLSGPTSVNQECKEDNNLGQIQGDGCSPDPN